MITDEDKLSESGNVQEAGNALAARLRDEFPNADIGVMHSINRGTGTLYGNSSYIDFRERESEKSHRKHYHEWADAGKGSKRGREPLMPRLYSASFRVSDHDVGDRRARQHVAIAPSATHEDVSRFIAGMREKSPWLSRRDPTE